ncbi:hypothetical protein NC652_018203 [Populus alba x Populus x berolinensis]|nr:hypothetical protein NC652_018203 [Populus alba x Populus x berolinensis]
MASHKAALLSSIVIMIVSLFVTFTEARDITLEAKIIHGKSLPLSLILSTNGLIWTYDPKKDSVHQVIKKDYETCNTSSPLVTLQGWQHEGEA